MIRVLHLLNSLELGGAEALLVNLLRHLPLDRVSITVATLLPEGQLASQIRDLGIRVVDLSGGERRFPKSYCGLKQLVQEFQPDVVHSHHLQATVVARWLRRRRAIKRLISTQHFLPLVHGGGLHHMAHRFTNRWDDVTVAVSNAVAHILIDSLRVPASQVTVIPNGVDLKRFDPPPEPFDRAELNLTADDLVIGTVARVTPEKGLDTLIEAAKIVAAEEPRVRFVFVGAGADLEALGAAVNVAIPPNLAPHIRTLPPTPAALHMMMCFDVFCLASRRESFGLAAAEAMAIGLPVVTTTAGGLADLNVNGETGLLVPPNDPKALAEALLTLLRDRSLAQSLGQRARERVHQTLSIEMTADQHLDLWEKIAV